MRCLKSVDVELDWPVATTFSPFMARGKTQAYAMVNFVVVISNRTFDRPPGRFLVGGLLDVLWHLQCVSFLSSDIYGLLGFNYSAKAS